MSEKPARALRLGDEFYVEPEQGEPIPVRFVAPGQWGLVHGVMELPCMRIDADQMTTVAIHMDSVVQMVEGVGA